ncbi:hypothetical protein EDB85DRAFT_857306 [Lactarius pseudohatsudake]|nr:hypothetical protein EDB85DRAFT_1252840 [Lactarius pseudohatsudake]KAH9014730.1 hypothetical protein EDB85DRAFT_857306 [Lactarius pseudohatsudake]
MLNAMPLCCLCCVFSYCLAFCMPSVSRLSALTLHHCTGTILGTIMIRSYGFVPIALKFSADVPSKRRCEGRPSSMSRIFGAV